MTYMIFYDFPILEDGLTKFHDFSWPADTLYYYFCHHFLFN